MTVSVSSAAKLLDRPIYILWNKSDKQFNALLTREIMIEATKGWRYLPVRDWSIDGNPYL